MYKYVYNKTYICPKSFLTNEMIRFAGTIPHEDFQLRNEIIKRFPGENLN
jgi:hypothetical protein